MDANELRVLINQRRGVDSMRDIAVAVGMNHSSLNEFMNGTRDVLSVESCLLLAQWLNVAAPVVLRMVGHSRIADLFATVDVPAVDPWADEFGKIVAGLSAKDVAAVLETARRHADVLRRSSGVTHGKSIAAPAAGTRENVGERRRRDPRN